MCTHLGRTDFCANTLLFANIREHAAQHNMPVAQTLCRGTRWCGADQGVRCVTRADFYMSLYNVVFTMAAPLVVGTINQDVNRATSRAFPGVISHSI